MRSRKWNIRLNLPLFPTRHPNVCVLSPITYFWHADLGDFARDAEVACCSDFSTTAQREAVHAPDDGHGHSRMDLQAR